MDIMGFETIIYESSSRSGVCAAVAVGVTASLLLTDNTEGQWGARSLRAGIPLKCHRRPLAHQQMAASSLRRTTRDAESRSAREEQVEREQDVGDRRT